MQIQVLLLFIIITAVFGHLFVTSLPFPPFSIFKSDDNSLRQFKTPVSENSFYKLFFFEHLFLAKRLDKDNGSKLINNRWDIKLKKKNP